MTPDAVPPRKPPRTWLTVVLWSVGWGLALLVLAGPALLVGTYIQVRRAIGEASRDAFFSGGGAGGGALPVFGGPGGGASYIDPLWNGPSLQPLDAIAEGRAAYKADHEPPWRPWQAREHSFAAVSGLGGPERAAPRLGFYLWLPAWLTPRREVASDLLGRCGPAAVPELIKLLAGKDPELKKDAIWALDKMGSDAGAAAPALGALLDDPSPLLKSMAMGALEHIGPEAVPFLARALDRPDTRASALCALFDCGPAAKPAIPRVLACLADENARIREVALLTLSHIGPEAAAARPEILRMLRTSQDGERVRVLETLSCIGIRECDADLLVELVEKDHLCEEAAIDLLVRMGPPGEKAIPALIGILLRDDSVRRQRSTLRVFATFGAPAVPGLLAVVTREPRQEGVFCDALEILRTMGPEARSAVPELVRMLDSSDSGQRANVLRTLAKIGHEARPAVPKVTAMLNDTKVDACFRAQAAWTLGHIDPGSEETVRVLVDAFLGDKEPSIQTAIAEALARIGAGTWPEAGVKTLRVNFYTAAMLHKERDSEGKCNAERWTWEGINDQAAMFAAAALARLEPKSAPQVCEYLVHMLEYPAHPHKSEALRALEIMGPLAASAAPALTRRLRDPHFEREILPALAAIGPGAAEAVPELLNQLNDHRTYDPEEVIVALGRIGPGAKDAVRDLKERRASGYWHERRAAQEALRRIEGGKAGEAAK